MLACVSRDPEKLEVAAPCLRDNPDVVMEAAKQQIFTPCITISNGEKSAKLFENKSEDLLRFRNDATVKLLNPKKTNICKDRP